MQHHDYAGSLIQSPGRVSKSRECWWRDSAGVAAPSGSLTTIQPVATQGRSRCLASRKSRPPNCSSEPSSAGGKLHLPAAPARGCHGSGKTIWPPPAGTWVSEGEEAWDRLGAGDSGGGGSRGTCGGGLRPGAPRSWQAAWTKRRCTSCTCGWTTSLCPGPSETFPGTSAMEVCSLARVSTCVCVCLRV